jgi:2-oxoglutarate dehydrogenase E2 component (dihydrolipoamide succinyltransferase)
MDGGTFTISNGGVFGSLMGTPIINPPQSAILGIHAINDRPVAINGKVMDCGLQCTFFLQMMETLAL